MAVNVICFHPIVLLSAVQFSKKYYKYKIHVCKTFQGTVFFEVMVMGEYRIENDIMKSRNVRNNFLRQVFNC